MNLVIATVTNPKALTGVHKHIQTFYDGVRDAGHLCAIVSSFSGSRKWLPIFAVRPLLLKHINKTWSTQWYRFWHYLSLRKNLRQYMMHNHADVVLAQDSLSAHAAVAVRNDLGLDYKVTFTCHFNGSEAEEFRKKGELNDDVAYQKMLAFEDATLLNVDKVIYVSKWSQDSVEMNRLIRPRNSTVIWNGIPAAVSANPALRATFGLEQDDLVLINVGTIDPRKNQIGLVNLFAAIVAKYPKARLLLVGDGPRRKEVQYQVNQLGLSGKVQLLGAQQDVSSLMQMADIYIHYALMESFGIVLLEAARAGIPVAALPVGGLAELLRKLRSVAIPAEGYGGTPDIQSSLEESVAIPAEGYGGTPDIQSSLEELDPLLSNPMLRNELGRRAQLQFRRFFTSEAMIDSFLEAVSFS